MLKIEEMCDYARYTDILEDVINHLGGVKVLRLNYESDYSGYVDIDVLLNDGRVLSYEYFYGSCSGCDEWESRDLSDEEIAQVMIQECTIFDDLDSYNKWRNTVNQKGGRIE